MKQRLLLSLPILLIIFVLTLSPHALFAGKPDDLVVRGVIKDPEGNPLGGASITEKGTTNTVVAGNNGNFSITVKDGAILTVSYVGYETQEIAAVAGSEMQISLLRQIAS